MLRKRLRNYYPITDGHKWQCYWIQTTSSLLAEHSRWALSGCQEKKTCDDKVSWIGCNQSSNSPPFLAPIRCTISQALMASEISFSFPHNSWNTWIWDSSKLSMWRSCTGVGEIARPDCLFFISWWYSISAGLYPFNYHIKMGWHTHIQPNPFYIQINGAHNLLWSTWC